MVPCTPPVPGPDYVRKQSLARSGPTVRASRVAFSMGNFLAHHGNAASARAVSTEEDRSVARLALSLQVGVAGADLSARRAGHSTGTTRAQAALRSHAAPGAEEGSR